MSITGLSFFHTNLADSVIRVSSNFTCLYLNDVGKPLRCDIIVLTHVRFFLNNSSAYVKKV